MTATITPANVSYYALEKQDENYAFRIFLKENADPEELDRQFHKLHQELFAEYDCASCRNCCKQYFEKPCRHLAKDGSCDLGEQKPDNCKDYPYTNRPDRMGSLLNTIEMAEVCPVVYEMLERLKETYHFYGKTAEKYLKLLNDYSNFDREFPEEIEPADPFMYLDFPQPKIRTEKKIYPNEPCPCGSGKKYKKCCGRK